MRNYRPSPLVASRKLKRVYPYHWGLVFGFHLEMDKGRLLESIVASLLGLEYYWREGGKEVDFLLRRDGKIIPIEVKAKEEVDANELKNMKCLMKKFGVERGRVVYPEKEIEMIELGGVMVECVPLVKLCLYGLTAR